MCDIFNTVPFLYTQCCGCFTIVWQNVRPIMRNVAVPNVQSISSDCYSSFIIIDSAERRPLLDMDQEDYAWRVTVKWNTKQTQSKALQIPVCVI